MLLFDYLAQCFVEVVGTMFAFTLMFNVSSFPLMFFQVGFLGLFSPQVCIVSCFIIFVFCLFIVRLLCFCLGLCAELLWLLCFYVHVQCLFVGFDDFLGKR